MKLIFKTAGWAAISAIIFFASAICNDCPWQGALLATIIATAMKTPAYPIWELVFEKALWKSSCTKPVLIGEKT